MENKTQTAVEWLAKQLELYGDPQYCEIKWNELDELIQQAKEMELKQTEKKDSVISQIDLELSLIEDYAKGEVGNAITTLRKKISNYYEENNYE